MSTFNLALATTILPQVVVPGEKFEIDFHVHVEGGNNFHWTSASGGPYSPVAKMTVGAVTITATSTVVSAGGGTAAEATLPPPESCRRGKAARSASAPGASAAPTRRHSST